MPHRSDSHRIVSPRALTRSRAASNWSASAATPGSAHRANARRKARGGYDGESRGGRPPAFDRKTYKQRNTVERCINRLKQWRGIATRYEKTASIHLPGLHIAGIFLGSAR